MHLPDSAGRIALVPEAAPPPPDSPAGTWRIAVAAAATTVAVAVTWWRKLGSPPRSGIPVSRESRASATAG